VTGWGRPRPGSPARLPRPRLRIFRPRRWALLLVLVGALAVGADLFFPAGFVPRHERRAILVERGQTLNQVAGELKRVGLLRGTLGFQVLARLMRLDRHVKAGQYEFARGTTVPELLRALAQGMSGLNLITIPEGLTMLETGVLLSHHLGVPIAAFDSLGHDRAFCDSLGLEAPSLEGYLAPDTYEFLPGTPPEVALRTMVARQKEMLQRAAAGRDSLPLGLSLHQLLILASIVECEAQQSGERARVARVYLNRLARDMKLQADPTVAYGMGMTPRSRLFLRYLRNDSPYNTYLYQGLPPGPICNPGAASFEAVLDPAPSEPSLYFVARGDGSHLFARTYEEHLANIRRARELRASAAASAESLRALDSLAVRVAGPRGEPAPGTR
jgi:UPF0755 protein